jgi:hypothetical protein
VKPVYTTASKHRPLAIYTDKKEKKIFLIYKEIQMEAVAKSYMRKGFLIYEEMRI